MRYKAILQNLGNIRKFLISVFVAILPIVIAALLEIMERTDIRIVVHPPVPCVDTIEIETRWVRCREFDIPNPVIMKLEFSNKSKTSLADQKLQFKLKNDSLVVYSFSKTDEIYSEIDSSGLIEKANGVFHYSIDELVKGKNHLQYFIANSPITAEDIEVSENLNDHKVIVQNKNDVNNYLEISIYVSLVLVVFILVYFFVFPKIADKQKLKSFKEAIESFNEK